jgi:hypothetical protein
MGRIRLACRRLIHLYYVDKALRQCDVQLQNFVRVPYTGNLIKGRKLVEINETKDFRRKSAESSHD